MKKVLILLAAVFTIPGISAQTNSHFGLKAGLNLATQNVDNTLATYSNRPGFIGGIFYQIEFSDFSIQPEVVFSQQGTNISSNGADLYSKLNYTSIPIILKYQLNSGVNFQFGPQIGFLMCAKSNYHPILNQEYKEQVYTTAYSTTDFLLAFGVGWKSDNNITIDARYNLGLTSINNYEGVPDTKNNLFSITVGYVIFSSNQTPTN